MKCYTICHREIPGRFWVASRGEALLYCTGDLLDHYIVVETARPTYQLTMADLVRSR